jgi:uncharacterized FlaG/YvyC family protein
MFVTLPRTLPAMLSVAFILTLTGCAFDNNSRQNGGSQSGPTITLNTVQKPVKSEEEIREDERKQVENREKESKKLTENVVSAVQPLIDASTQNLNKNLSGHIVTEVGKLAETVKGVEAKVDTTITATNTMKADLSATVTATNNMRADLSANITATNNMRADLNATITAVNHMQADVRATVKAELDPQIGAFNTLRKQVENLQASAGRDQEINYLPQKAVNLLVAFMIGAVVIILIIAGATTYIVCVQFRNARIRESERTKTERVERVKLFELLSKALIQIPPEHAAPITRAMEEVSRGLVDPLSQIPPQGQG